MALVSDVIKDFELFMDDTTELSTVEEIRIAEKHSQRIANQYPWLKLRKEGSGTVASRTVALPTRFDYLVENYNETAMNEYADGPVVLVGTSRKPYKVVSYEDRKRYVDRNGYVYVDISNDVLAFTGSDANGETVSFDYQEYPATLTDASDTLWIPDRFVPALYHSMCVDDFVIQQSEKARSYRDENLAAAQMWINEMRAWDGRLRQMS